MKKPLVLLVLVLGLISWLYLPLVRSYFQHDEIRALGTFITTNATPSQSIITAFYPNRAHYVPLHHLVFALYVSVFKLNFEAYALLSIASHLAVTVGVYFLADVVFKNKIQSLAVAGLFGTFAAIHQATTWPLADINVHGAALFAVISLICWFKGKPNSALVYLLISLLFKEIAIGFFVIYLWLALKGKQKTKRETVSKVGIVGGLYGALRALMLFAPQAHVDDQVVFESQSVSEVVKNLLNFPSKIIAQTLIPANYQIVIFKRLAAYLPMKLTGLPGTTAFDLFIENKVLHYFAIAVLASVVVLWWQTRKRGKNSFVLAFSLAFVIVNSLIYVFSPARGGVIPVVDSRNLYLPAVGFALFIVAVVDQILTTQANKVLLVAGLVLVNSYWLQRAVGDIAQVGLERKQILQRISSDYPTLPLNVIVLAESDSAYYGLPEAERTLPFQTNFGYNLLLWYSQVQYVPKDFLSNPNFLYKLTDQQYLEVGDYAYGYFYDRAKLREFLVLNKLDLNAVTVVSYYYDSKQHVLIQTNFANGL